MKNTAKKVVSVTALISIVSALTITAYAYLGVKDEKDNKVKVGEADISIIESFTEPDIQNEEDIYIKEVKFKNTDSEISDSETSDKILTDVFIRVYMSFSDSRVRDKSALSFNGTDYYAWDGYIEQLKSQNWIYIPDEDDKLGGYFYYNKILKPDEETSLLIKNVQTNFNNTDDITDFDIIVYSEVIQTVGNDGKVFKESEWKEAWKMFLKAE